jgi:hypothetical protein
MNGSLAWDGAKCKWAFDKHFRLKMLRVPAGLRPVSFRMTFAESP